MTRINSDIDPSILKRVHLVAELREITMVPASLRRSLRTRTPEDILAGIPNEFTLNKGHVTFFYNKLSFLRKRFYKLVNEMRKRGYSPDCLRVRAFDGFDDIWYEDWNPSPRDDQLVIDRINLRISQKPHLYKNG